MPVTYRLNGDTATYPTHEKRCEKKVYVDQSLPDVLFYQSQTKVDLLGTACPIKYASCALDTLHANIATETALNPPRFGIIIGGYHHTLMCAQVLRTRIL